MSNNTMYDQINFEDLINKGERYIKKITYNEAKYFLLNIHYARRMPSISYAFGLIENGQLIGVVTYGTPASRPLCIGLAGKENSGNVLELNRLCFLPNYNGGNRASYLIANTLKRLPNKTFVVSYADTAWSHIGYVYQATNFLYTGLSKDCKDTYQPNGLHPRSYNKNNHSEKKQTRSRKHRYIYLVGDKRTKKEMRKALKYQVLDEYPKGDETRYNIENPQIINPIRIIE